MRDVQIKIDKLLEHNSPSEVLVAFDIDMTLTQPDHPAVYYPVLKKYYDSYKQIMSELTPSQRDLAATLSLLLPQKLVEDINSTVVNNLQQQGLQTMAFTASLTGSLKNDTGNIVRIEQIRYDSLQQFNINFSKTFAIEEIIFTDMPVYHGSHPVFYKGILLANGEKGIANKGSVLIAFLKRIHNVPKAIVMIDDKLQNLKDIQIFLQQHNPDIKFLGIEYQGALNYMPQEISKEDFELFWQNMAQKAKSSE